MKKIYALCLLCTCMLCMLSAAAEGTATPTPSLQPILYTYACDLFSIVLPEGLRAADDAQAEGWIAAALGDTALEENPCQMVALDEQGQSGMTISVLEQTGDSAEIATGLATALAERFAQAVVSPVQSMSLTSLSGCWFTVELEGTEYLQAVLMTDMFELEVTCVGLDYDAIENSLNTLAVT